MYVCELFHYCCKVKTEGRNFQKKEILIDNYKMNN